MSKEDSIDLSCKFPSDSSNDSDATRIRGRGRGRGKQMHSEDELPRPGFEGGVKFDSYDSKKTESLASDVQSLSLVSVMERPNYGTKGRPIPLFANYFAFEMKIKKGNDELFAHRYECNVECAFRKIDRDEKREVFWAAVSTNPSVFIRQTQLAYDDSNCLWTMEKLHLDGGMLLLDLKLKLSRDNRPSDYVVSLKFTGTFRIDLKEVADANHLDRTSIGVQLIDTVMSQGLRCPIIKHDIGWYPWARSIYRLPTLGNHQNDAFPPIDLPGGREVWTGFHMAAKVGQGWKPIINVDVTNTAFTKRIPLTQFLCDILNANGRDHYSVSQMNRDTALDDMCRKTLDKALKGLKLKTTHMSTNRVYRYNAIGEPASKIAFTPSGKEETTVAAYFSEKYRPLLYPNLPVLHVGPRTKAIFLPMEVCSIADEPQKVTKKLTDKETAKMIREVSRPATDRKNLIESLLTSANYTHDPFVQEFGFNMSLQMVQFAGRILATPKLDFGRKLITPREGVWKIDTKFAVPATHIHYSLVSMMPENMRGTLEAFCQNQVSACKQFGMSFVSDWPASVIYLRGHDLSSNGIRQSLMEAAKPSKTTSDENINLVFVVMNERRSDLYAAIKAWGDIDKGVMTQVVLRQNVDKVAKGNAATNATSLNIAMKLNAKMGGVNNGIATMEEVWRMIIQEEGPTMFVGIDVTHPGIGDNHSPSIASVVANIDLAATKYMTVIKAQRKRLERIVYLVDGIKKLLGMFYKKTGKQPRRIIVYRDGISEGEFTTILREEMLNIRKACSDLDLTYKPTITFVVVQKRHHTRFFAQRSTDQVGRAKNVPPGTCVDTVVTHPCEFDFFICSHFGIQGTSRPTHYICLHDDWGLTADQLQMITYHLCHLYVRCPRTVSIPAPVYYAHLCCFRARFHNQARFGSGSESTERPELGDRSTAGSEQELTQALTVHEFLENTMYFV